MSREESVLKLKSHFPSDWQADLITLRETLHAHPELSGQEHQTARTLTDALKKLKPKSVERIADTGVVARIVGSGKGPTVAIRGDMDALPIQENTGASFQSTVPGVMHACGHDIHATWAVGAAVLLAEDPAIGDVLVVLQPAEESAEGAKAILKSGVLSEAKAIFGAHVDMGFEVGTILLHRGPVAASSDTFEITVRGKGAHGARPHEGQDPILAAAALVQALHTIVSRRIHPADAAVISIGHVQAGTTHNVIPETCLLLGTIRALDPQVRETLHQEIESICQHLGSAYHCNITCHIQKNMPPIVNVAPTIDWAYEAAAAFWDKAAILSLPKPNLASEDFAYYLESIPGTFARIGARTPGKPVVPAHSSGFLPDTNAIWVGAYWLAESARRAAMHLAG